MKNFSVYAGAALLLCASAGTALADGTIILDKDPSGPWNASQGGGGFRATGVSGDNGLLRNGRGGTGSSLITFCLELNEGIDSNVVYNTHISDSANKGGVGGPHPDPLGSQTAVLFWEFHNGGTFGGIAPAGLGTASWSTALTDALQRALWYGEEEVTTLGTPLATALWNWALEATDNDGIDDVAGFQNGGIGIVRVLNVTDSHGNNMQDLLTIAPLPSAAWAGLGTLAGVAGFGFIRRRKLAAQ